MTVDGGDAAVGAAGEGGDGRDGGEGRWRSLDIRESMLNPLGRLALGITGNMTVDFISVPFAYFFPREKVVFIRRIPEVDAHLFSVLFICK